MEELKKWIEDKSIACEIDGNVIDVVDFGKCVFLEEKEGRVIEDDFSFILYEEEAELLESEDIKYIVFKWGEKFFYSEKKTGKDEYNELVYKPSFNEFFNVGSHDNDSGIGFIHLGVHTGYELLNGSAEPEYWVKRASFLKHKELGVCDRNTLASSLPFQIACKKKDIKSIIGETVTVAYNYKSDDEYHNLFDLKLYAINEKGWRNLLRVNKAINVDYDKFIPEKELLSLSEGLICVFDTDSYFNSIIFKPERVEKVIKRYRKSFGRNLYYQIDTVEFDDDSVDIEHLKIIRKYINDYSDSIKPILINDSYYIDSGDHKIKSMLNNVDKKTRLSSDNQSYKTIEEVLENLLPHFQKNPDKFDVILKAIDNTVIVGNRCNFQIDTGNHKLPKFEVEDPIELYHSEIAKGFQKKVIDKFRDDEDKIRIYFERIEEENDVIVNAGFVDYFLILWDIIKWSNLNDILVGPGRGSAGGSLVAYLLGIIEIDPIEYDLLFERFLNKTRVSGERAKAADALPDIDVDFEGNRRGDVKRYIEEKYTFDNVCSVGTYSRMKVKSALKDFARVVGIPFDAVNIATKTLPDNQGKSDWGELFSTAVKKPSLKEFVQENAEICDLIRISNGQPRSASIHPSAVLIVPKEDKEGNPMTVFDWLPVKKMEVDGYGVLVSEWEGKYIDSAGFLKADILGIAQLDKFHNILDLIKLNRGKKVSLNKIKVDKEDVMYFFKQGWNEDVFQFGTGGLKNYSKKVSPDTIEELISMNALFRPGPMDSGAHNDFADIKHGKKKPKFDFALDVVTSKTFGLYVYQEQIMQAMVVGGLTLSEADQVRTYMKKFDDVSLAKFKEKFIEGYSKLLDKKKAQEVATAVWEKLYAFSGYGFNRSHSAAYTLMGYWCQYLKVKYPLEFWTASLNFANYDEEVPNRISEIRKIGSDISLKPPCVNKSDLNFVGDPTDNSIYWSLTKIKNVGEIAAKMILSCRAEKGEFMDLEDFISRVPKNKVNKRVVKALIIAGAFDNIGGDSGLAIQEVKDRLQILQKHCALVKSDEYEETKDANCNYNWYWVGEQKKLTGFGDINYKPLLEKICRKSKNKDLIKNFMTSEDMENKSFRKDGPGGRSVTVVGRIVQVQYLTYKVSKLPYARISIESNNFIIKMRVWNDTFVRTKKKIEELEKTKSLFAVNCKIKTDDWGTELVSIDERASSREKFFTDFIELK